MELTFKPSTLQSTARQKRKIRRSLEKEIRDSFTIKRCIDIGVAIVSQILLTPLFAIVALLIKLNDHGPILFWQTRVGKHGREFPFPKFRSMCSRAESLKFLLRGKNHHKNGTTFKIRRDPRITWVGKYLRKFSIDELPQLWCVLRGDMSLVGPRPAVPEEVEKYSEYQRKRLEVVPGLTCIWQVSGRGDLPFDEQVKLDIKYIESQSLLFDLWLLIRTIPAVILAKGAY